MTRIPNDIAMSLHLTNYNFVVKDVLPVSMFIQKFDLLLAHVQISSDVYKDCILCFTHWLPLSEFIKFKTELARLCKYNFALT